MVIHHLLLVFSSRLYDNNNIIYYLGKPNIEH